MSLLALVVEDDPTLRTVFTGALMTAGYETESVADGQSALDYLVHATPDLVILDLHLPKASGKDVLLHLRSNEPFNKTRILITSADTELLHFLKEDADQVLEKPISFYHLRQLALDLRSSFDAEG